MTSDILSSLSGVNTGTGSVSSDRDDRTRETEQARRAARAVVPMAFGPLAYTPGESESQILALGLSCTHRSGWDTE